MMLERQAESVQYMAGCVQESPEVDSQQHCPKTLSLEAGLREITTTITLLRSRIDNSLTVLTGSLSIYESQKGIAQAAEVKNLARLAHFYLPLTVVAGVFSMGDEVLPFRPTPSALTSSLIFITCLNILLLNFYSIPLGGAAHNTVTRLWKRSISCVGHFFDLFSRWLSLLFLI